MQYNVIIQFCKIDKSEFIEIIIIYNTIIHNKEEKMSVYLETNALRKLTSYKCKESVYTSIFSIFELLSGITEKDFEIRKACLKRIKEQKIEIQGPMIDKLFMDLVGITEYNKFAYKMIMDTYYATLEAENYSHFNNIKLLGTDKNNKNITIHAHTWLKDWDCDISNITKNIKSIVEDENKEYIKNIYDKGGDKALAEHSWGKMYNNRVDEERLSHAEPFIGADTVKTVCQEMDVLFSRYNYKLFLVAQAVIFLKAFFINGNTQNANNASDLLHLLYLKENDEFVSNDKIYKTISKACPEFKLIVLDNEKNLSDLL